MLRNFFQLKISACAVIFKQFVITLAILSKLMIVTNNHHRRIKLLFQKSFNVLKRLEFREIMCERNNHQVVNSHGRKQLNSLFDSGEQTHIPAGMHHFPGMRMKSNDNGLTPYSRSFSLQLRNYFLVAEMNAIEGADRYNSFINFRQMLNIRMNVHDSGGKANLITNSFINVPSEVPTSPTPTLRRL